jgi:hypothetical protein
MKDSPYQIVSILHHYSRFLWPNPARRNRTPFHDGGHACTLSFTLRCQAAKEMRHSQSTSIKNENCWSPRRGYHSLQTAWYYRPYCRTRGSLFHQFHCIYRSSYLFHCSIRYPHETKISKALQSNLVYAWIPYFHRLLSLDRWNDTFPT